METLYRYYSVNDELLYVGVTCRMTQRFRDHKKQSQWFCEISRSTYEHYPDRESVLRAEREAIQNERPKYNKIHNTRLLKEARRKPFEPETGISLSGDAIVARLVMLKPMRPLRDVASDLGIQRHNVTQAIEKGHLGYIDLPNSNGTKMNRYVSGWQLLDWLESLSARQNLERP